MVIACAYTFEGRECMALGEDAQAQVDYIAGEARIPHRISCPRLRRTRSTWGPGNKRSTLIFETPVRRYRQDELPGIVNKTKTAPDAADEDRKFYSMHVI